MKVGDFEFRPAAIRHPQLGVADLPEQEIADPHFARRTHEQVGIGHAAGVKVIGDRRLIDLDRVELAAAGFAVLSAAVGWWYFERSRNAFAAYL